MTLTEISYRAQNAATKDGVESSLIQIYLEILRYSAEVMKIQRSNKAKKLLQAIIAMNEIPLEGIKTCIANEESRLERWLSLQQFLQCRKDANKILAQGSEILEAVHNIDERFRDSKLFVVESAVFGTCQKYPADECLPGTRTELLQKITDWVDNPSGEALFWLEGMAGTGKSTISRSFARSMKDRGLLAATFFFNRGESERANLRRFAPTIARQIASAVPVLKDDILDTVSFASAELAVQFAELLFKPLSKLKTTNGQRLPQVIVIDALDECEDGNMQLFLQLLSQLNHADSAIDFRIFITSRPENPINSWLKKIIGENQTMALQMIDLSTIGHDISLFLKSKLTDIRDARSDESLGEDWPGQESIQILIKMAIPLFISAATICRELMDIDFPAEIVLRGIIANRYENSNLAATYQPVLSKLIRDRPKEQCVKIAEEVRIILGAIVLLEDLLPIEPLANLIGISHQIVMKRVRSVSSVLMLPQSPDEPARAFHKSFRDFLLDPETDRNLFGVDAVEMHKKLAFDCVRVMQRTEGGLRKSICRLESYGTLRAQIDDARIALHMSKELQYACRHWVDHLRQAKVCISDGDEIHLFLGAYFLPWVEAMILLGYISEPIKAIDTLRSITWQVGTGSALSLFLYDSERFLVKNTSIAEAAPLQLYSPGLVFTPHECTLRKRFQNLLPKCFAQLPVVESQWGPVLQSFKSKSADLDTVCFSPDHSMLVSSSPFTLNLWNTKTGTLRQTLDENFGSRFIRTENELLKPGTSVAFSPNGKLIASVIDNKTVRLWDVTPGLVMLQRTLVVVDEGVYKVAFSPDSELLALACVDNTIQIWSLESESLEQTLEGHTDAVICVVFSSDGRFLASSSHDYTLRLWDISSWPFKLMTTLTVQSSFMKSVVFSPDSRSLASLTKRVLVWDMVSGELKNRPSARNPYDTDAITFSSDGQCIICASDTKVRILNISLNEEVCTLQGPTHDIKSLSLSSDGTLLAACAEEEIWIWDVSPSVWPQTQSILAGTSEPKRLLFSPDRTLAASTTSHRLILWDPHTGKRLFSINEGSFVMEPVVFSSDSRVIAMRASSDATVKIWSTDSGLLINTIGDDDIFGVIALSDDGTLVASVVCNVIKIWDVVSGRELQRIEVTDHEPVSLAFSHNGKMLAVGFDEIVEIGERKKVQERVVMSSEGNIPEEMNDIWVLERPPPAYQVRSLTIWDTKSGELISNLRHLEKHYDRIETLAFSPDDKLLAASSSYAKMKAWDITSHTLVPIQAPVAGFELDFQPRIWFSEDGSMVKTNVDSYEICREDQDGLFFIFEKRTPYYGRASWRIATVQGSQHSLAAIRVSPCYPSFPQ